jgi:hypothetical protein
MWNLHKKAEALGSKAARFGAVALAASGVSLLVASPALAQTAESGAQFINPVNSQPLTGVQGSNTDFEILLPPGAACSGDTATDGYLVFSYVADNALIPDPGTITYNSAGPEQADAYPLIDTGGDTYGPQNTVAGTGAVPEPIPTFNWNQYAAVGAWGSSPAAGTPLYPGTFNVGISCEKNGPADNYWNTQIVFTASSTDPNGFVWQVVPPVTTPEIPFAIGLPLTAAGIAGLSVLVLRRRRQSSVVVG